MKRLVYSPKVYAYVKADTGTYDLTEYIVGGGVERKLDQVSSAKLSIRNPGMKWTDLKVQDPVSGETVTEPIFHPMDPITIILQRLQNRPVQVFTGFLDKTPYFQLHPGTMELRASCTLKKLQYTFFDAGLPFFDQFLTSAGWNYVPEKGAVNLEAGQNSQAVVKGGLTESGFGKLLLDTMRDIGNWPESTIYIEKIPTGLIELVTELFEEGEKESEEANQQLIHLLHKIIGTASLGTGELSTGTGPATEEGVTRVGATEGTVTGTNMTPEHAQFCEEVAVLTGLSLHVLGAWVGFENGPPDNPLNIGPGASFGTVQAGAKATSKLLHQSYAEVLATAGESDQTQMEAIAASPWCPGCAGYLQTLEGVYPDIHVESHSNKSNP